MSVVGVSVGLDLVCYKKYNLVWFFGEFVSYCGWLVSFFMYDFVNVEKIVEMSSLFLRGCF